MISTLLVGFGFSAKTFHLPFLTCLDDFCVAGVVSSRPEAVGETLPDVNVWPSLGEALANGAFDLVIVTTPNHLHATQAREALMAGCNVLVEKPFTLDAKAASELVALAHDKGLDLSVYHNRRYDGDFLTLKSLLNARRFGTVRRFESRFDRFRPSPRNRWRENAGPGSGITWDLAPHLVDQALLLFGMPETVFADIRTLRDGGQSDDTFDITLSYPQLQVKLASSPFQAAPTLRFDIQGDHGSFRKYYLDPQESQLRDGKTPADTAWAKTHPDEDGVFYYESSLECVATHRGNYQGFYQQLARAVRSEGPSPSPASENVQVIRILELARQSADAKTVMAVN